MRNPIIKIIVTCMWVVHSSYVSWDTNCSDQFLMAFISSREGQDSCMNWMACCYVSGFFQSFFPHLVQYSVIYVACKGQSDNV
jgi:hypothetical protein